MPITTTLGRELIRRKLPDKFKDWADKPMTKGNIAELTTKLALDDPDKYVDILNDLDDIGESVVSTYGRDAALSFSDASPGKETLKIKTQLRMLVNNVINDPKLTTEQKEERIKELGYKYSQKIQEAVFEDQDKRGTALAAQINSGSRGNKTQLMQMLFGDMLMKDALNRDIPYLATDAYASGAGPFSYWVSASSGRKGNWDVQAATGQSGYLGKQVTNVTHSATIEADDCGTTDTGIPVAAASAQNIGAVLLRPFKGHPAGTVVDEDMVAEAGDDDEMVLRSPTTCKCRTGVCAKCNGLNENGKFPGLGEYVSLNAARTFVEKVTQASVGSKHVGGVGGKKNIDPDGEDQPTGFRAMERMFMVPSNFPGGAVLAPVDGIVENIRPAPQGGNYITVGTKTVYARPERTFSVKKGDKVYAGDVLTNGVPNPAEVVSYKGIGEGRHYYLNKLSEVLKKAGAGTNRRNIESFSRAMINKVRITSPDGYGSHLPGDIVDYSEVAADYTPRDDAIKTEPDKAVHRWLEKPVLNYSIGTRVTPSIANNLKKYGFNEVLTSAEPPPFSAEFLRPATALQNDKNWLPRLSGERLYDSLFDAARKGITDKWDSTSFVDKIIASPFKG